MQRRATIPVALRSANMCTRHLRRRGIQTIARRRKRAASGGGRVRGSCPPTEFRSPSSHRASGIVRHGGDQMPSRQLFDSSRFDRDHLTASGRRAAPRATRCSPRNVCFRLAARSFASRSRRSIEGVWPRTRAASSNPSAKLAPHRAVARRLRPFSSSTGCPDANKVGHLRPMAFPERFAAGPERRHGPQTERGAEHGTNAGSRRINAPTDRLLKSG